MKSELVLFETDIIGQVTTKSSTKYSKWVALLEDKLQHAPTLGDRFLSIEIEARIRKARINARRRLDVDNISKVVLDAITASGMTFDDSMIHKLEVTKFGTDGPEIMSIVVREWVC
mgnify:FL=1